MVSAARAWPLVVGDRTIGVVAGDAGDRAGELLDRTLKAVRSGNRAGG